MPTITIPQELAQEKKLIAIPYKTYEEFLEWQRNRKNSARGAYMTLTELHDAMGVKN